MRARDWIVLILCEIVALTLWGLVIVFGPWRGELFEFIWTIVGFLIFILVPFAAHRVGLIER